MKVCLCIKLITWHTTPTHKLLGSAYISGFLRKYYREISFSFSSLLNFINDTSFHFQVPPEKIATGSLELTLPGHHCLFYLFDNHGRVGQSQAEVFFRQVALDSTSSHLETQNARLPQRTLVLTFNPVRSTFRSTLRSFLPSRPFALRPSLHSSALIGPPGAHWPALDTCSQDVCVEGETRGWCGWNKRESIHLDSKHTKRSLVCCRFFTSSSSSSPPAQSRRHKPTQSAPVCVTIGQGLSRCRCEALLMFPGRRSRALSVPHRSLL